MTLELVYATLFKKGNQINVRSALIIAVGIGDQSGLPGNLIIELLGQYCFATDVDYSCDNGLPGRYKIEQHGPENECLSNVFVSQHYQASDIA